MISVYHTIMKLLFPRESKTQSQTYHATAEHINTKSPER